MKNDRETADDILDQALAGRIDYANALLSSAVEGERGGRFRAQATTYLIVIFSLAILCLGIDALDGRIIDHL
jgi:hypothetical protein